MERAILVGKWVGRITSLALAGFVILLTIYVFGSGKNVSAKDAIGVACMVCFFIGLILSWPFERLGIVLSYTGYFSLVILMLTMGDKDVLKFWFAIIPTTLLLACRLAAKRNAKTDTLTKTGVE
jgi:flagellar biosynthesis component FlhA